MKKTIKIILLTIVAIFVITLTSSVNANYQVVYKSNADSYLKLRGDAMIDGMRNMEAQNQVMGLNETHNASTLMSTSDSNYIDVHLIKNTEYGAMALLSASTKYGKQGSGTTRYVGTGTTTGNVFGVYMNNLSNGEWVAAGVGPVSGRGEPFSEYINNKYVNRYANDSARFNGDALLWWHNNDYLAVKWPYAIIRGSGSRGIYRAINWAANSNGAYTTARPAVVCGENF